MGAKRGQEWLEYATTQLRRAGYQRSDARLGVIEALAAHDCAVTAPELEAELRGREPTAGRATVYRVLEQLERLELVHRVDVGREISSFERAGPGTEHHHHIVCQNCGRINPFEDKGLERVVKRVSKESSFAISEHEIVLRGMCPSCSS
jgi:Fur family ferric uptake transcriptional regulator